MIPIIISLGVFIVSVLVTKHIINYLIKFSLVDIPNHRSLHKSPVPRGGGVVIFLFILLAFFILYVLKIINLNEFLAFSLSLIITMLVALIDDRVSLSIKIRAFFYFISAISFLLFLKLEWGYGILFCIAICIVWMINLYNFMDGIDGIASIEAISVSLFSLFIFHQLQAQELFYLSLVLFSSTAGFLIWNWSPAKVFLGDVGSCSLGLIFSMIAIFSYVKYEVPVEIWLVLLSVFIADTSFTLIKRVFFGEKWYQAHKKHAYQVLISTEYSHKTVSILVFLFNILITWPFAYWIYLHSQHSVIVVLLNYAILLILWYKIQKTHIQNT